jgi:hypothetical protein
LKSNRWYLAAIAVLLPAAFVVSLTVDWFEHVGAQTGDPVAVPFGDTVEYAEARWSVSDTHTAPSTGAEGRDLALPTGTELLSVTLDVEPGTVPPSCRVAVVDRAGSREWDEAFGLDSSYRIAESAESYCDSSLTDPYSVEFVFVVPLGASDGASMRLEVGEELPRFLVFDLGL